MSCSLNQVISKVCLNSVTILEKQEMKNISHPYDAQEKYHMLKHNNGIKTIKNEQRGKGQHCNGLQREFFISLRNRTPKNLYFLIIAVFHY